ncbi:hypothetical protein Pcinc_004556 [Petrolisthes cinctipes]|uniref:Uncharacterized protein n=1 Tax=Petrolisthes cinctipes TaxID=88211 RepID=A0AAE1GGT3_PETCI|nr:hypothetical protein Pcinc_004556 [Petrolisthes cinctipes]
MFNGDGSNSPLLIVASGPFHFDLLIFRPLLHQPCGGHSPQTVRYHRTAGKSAHGPCGTSASQASQPASQNQAERSGMRKGASTPSVRRHQERTELEDNKTGKNI